MSKCIDLDAILVAPFVLGYLYENINKDSAGLIEGLANVIIEADNIDVRDTYTDIQDSYYTDIAIYAQSMAPAVALEFFNQDKSIVEFDFGSTNPAVLGQSLRAALENRLNIEKEQNSIAETLNKDLNKIQEPVLDIAEELEPTDMASDMDITSNEVKESNPLSELGEKRQKLGIGELNFSQLASVYFENSPQLIEDFESTFVNIYYDKLVDTRVSSKNKGYNKDIGLVMAQVVAEFESKLSPELLENSKEVDLLNETDATVRNAYYASIVSSQDFSSVVRAFLPEIKYKADKDAEGNLLPVQYYLSEDSEVRASGFSTYDGGHSGLDQISDVAKRHIYTTPRMSQMKTNGSAIAGKYFVDKNVDARFISTNELKQVVSVFSSFSPDADSFAIQLGNKVKLMNDSDPTKVVLESIYNKFFSPKTYTIDGIERQSILQIAKEQGDIDMDEIVTSFMVGYRSMVNKEIAMVRNGNFEISKMANPEVASVIKENIEANMSSPSNPTILNPEIAKKLKVQYINKKLQFTLGNKIFTISNNSKIKNNTSGVVVNIDDESRGQFEDVSTAYTALRNLGFPNDITRKFAQYYLENVNRGFTSDDITMPNLIANFAYMAAMNDEEMRGVLYDAGFGLPSDTKTKEKKTLLYPIFKTLFDSKGAGFLSRIQTFTELAEGIQAKKTALNSEGNVIALTPVSNRIKDIINVIPDIQNDIAMSTDLDNNVYNGNPLVNGKPGGTYNDAWLEIESFVDKDGITVLETQKGNSTLTHAEQFKYLIEGGYLSVGAKNKFTKAVFQPAVFSDRSEVPMALTSIKSTAQRVRKFLPVTDGIVSDYARKDFIESQRNFHNSMANNIVYNWKQLLSSPAWGSQDVSRITDIKSLNKELIEGGLTADMLIATDMVKERDYVVAKDGTIKIKEAFLEMHKIFNDEKLAGNFAEKMLRQFKNDLFVAGYSKKSLDRKSVSILSEHFGVRDEGHLFNQLINGFFYQSNTVNNSIMAISMGSIYQFEGDMDVEAMVNSKAMKDLERDLIISYRKTDAEAEAIVLEEARSLALLEANSKMFVAQSKRNATLGTGIQKPRTVSPDNEGAFIETEINTAIIDDPEEVVTLLGKLDPNLKQEVYDATFFMHPLYKELMNRSLGGSMSGFTSKGGAFKTISTDTDFQNRGTVRIQKKAEFNMFANDIMRNGDPALWKLWDKMNTVPLNFEVETSEGDIIDIDNMNDLMEAYGGWSNPDVWVDIADGIQDGSIPKEARNAFISLVGFTSGEKTGNKKINTVDVWKTDAGLEYTKMSTKYHGVIQQNDHNPDTTASQSNSAVPQRDNEVSLPTQIISAAILQGETSEFAFQINDALLNLSTISLDRIESDIKVRADRKIAERVMRGLEADPEEAMDDAMKDWATELAKDAISKREAYGVPTDLINASNPALDSLQLANVTHSAIKAKFNKDTVKIKFKGGQFVVSASHDFIKLYRIPGTTKDVMRSDYMKSSKVKTEVINSTEGYNSNDEIRWSGVKMTLNAAKKIQGFEQALIDNEIKAKVLPRNEEGSVESRSLDWVKYTAKDGTKLEDFKAYKDLYANGKALMDIAAKAKKGTISEDEATSQVKELESKRDDLKVALMTILEDPHYEWETVDAEFYMPMMHQQAYNLYSYGKGGDENTDLDDNLDSIMDIMGDEEEGSQAEFDHMFDFFRSRISRKDVQRKYKLDKYDLSERITSEYYEATLSRLENELKFSKPGSLEESVLKRQVDALKTYSAKTEDGLELTSRSVRGIQSVYSDVKEGMIDALAHKHALNFPQTLRFITGRVPAQGKQSYMVGRAKGFITSNRNAIYGAAEMLTVTGADHDIDKANIIAYSVNSEGELYRLKEEWLNDDGSINASAYKSSMAEERERYLSLLKSRKLTQDELESAIDSFDKKASRDLQEAVKNYVVDKLIAGIADTRNAVEAGTPVSMDKLKKLINKALGKLGTWDAETGLILEENTFSSQYNPASIPNLEITNSIGKIGISTYATAIKSYSATFTAYLKGMQKDSEYTKFKHELNTGYKGQEAVEELYIEKFGEIDESLSLYIEEDGEIIRKKRSTIANAGKWNKTNQETRRRYAAKLADAHGRNLTEEEIDAELGQDADRLVGKAKIDKNGNVVLDSQAWEDLSELLSAATDNAKELILGRIGATSTTNGLIAAGIIIGWELEDVINIFKNPEVAKAIKEVEDSADTTKNKGNVKSLNGVLSLILKDKFGKNNSLFNYQISEAKRTVDFQKAIVAKVDKQNIIGEQEKAGVKSMSEITLRIPENHYNIGGNLLEGFNKEIIKSTSITDSDRALLQRLAKEADVPFPGNETQASNLLNTIKGSSAIIIDEKKIDKTDMAWVRLYAKENGIPYYEFSAIGRTLFSFNEQNERKPYNSSPILGKNTALISNNTEQNSFKNLLEQAAVYTQQLVENPGAHVDSLNLKKDNALKKLEGSERYLNKAFNNFFTDGTRQLQMLLKISEENRAVVNILSINQGLANDAWNSFNYYNKFVNRINKIVDGDFISRDGLKDFIKSAAGRLENDNGEFANDIIKGFEKHKTGINPFFVLKENAHYFGYILSDMTAEKIIKSVTFAIETTESTIDFVGAPFQVNPTTEDVHSESSNFVHGLSIENFFTSNLEFEEFSLENLSFDLTSNTSREKFVRTMVDVVRKYKDDDRYKDNPAMQAMRFDPIRDAKLGTYLNIIRMNDLRNISPNKRLQIELGLKQLREQNKELHEALYVYNLILNKGGRNKKSFASLFGNEEDSISKMYNDHLNKLKKEKTTIINIIQDTIGWESTLLSIPSLIKVIDTDGTRKRKITSANSLDDDGSFDESDFYEYDDVTRTYSKSVNGTNHDNYYSIPTDPDKFTPVIFKSRQTGKTYMYNDSLKQYVVLTSKVPLKIIPYSVNGGDVLSKSGFQYGETAIINDSEEEGQILYYDQYKDMYYVEMKRGGFEYMSGDTLGFFNKNMTFRKHNFGKMTVDEQTLEGFNQVLSPYETNVNVITLSSAEKEIINSNDAALRYIPLAEGAMRSDAKVGEIMGFVELGNGVKAKLVYEGKLEKRSDIANAMGGNKLVKEGNIYHRYIFKKEPQHIVSIQLQGTPDILPTKEEMPLATTAYRKLSGSNSAKFLNSGSASHFVSSLDLKIEEGSTKLIALKDGKRTRYYEATNLGNAAKYKADKRLSEESLANELGYSAHSTSLRNLRKSIKEGVNIYVTKPYNAKAHYMDTMHEFNRFDEEVVPNIKDVKITSLEGQYQDGNGSLIREVAEVHGFPSENVDSVFNVNIKPAEEQLIKERVEVANKMKIKGEDKSVNDGQRAALSLMFSDDVDAIVINGFVKNLSPDQKAALDIARYSRLTEAEEELNSMVKSKKTASDLEFLSELLANIRRDNLKYNELAEYKKVADSKEALASIVESTLIKLRASSETPVDLRQIVGNAFVTSQIAKQAGKPLYIYDDAKRQWFKYDANSGSFDKVSIPVMEGNFAMVNTDMIDKKKGHRFGLDTLMKKTSQFKSKQTQGVGELITPEELVYGSGVINPEINEVILSENPTEGVNGISKFSFSDFNQPVVIGTKKFDGIVIDGETYLEDDFKEFSEDSVIEKLNDGTITIKSNTETSSYFWVAFPDESKRKNDYADYTGNKVNENYKIKIGEDYFIFDKLHLTNESAFSRRDQVIEEKAKLKELHNKVKEIYQNEVNAPYSAIRYVNAEKAYNDYRSYNSYASFMTHLKSGTFELDSKQEENLEALMEADKSLRIAKENLEKYKRFVYKKYAKRVIPLNTYAGSFFDNKARPDNEKLVFISDNNKSHSFGAALKAKQSDNPYASSSLSQQGIKFVRSNITRSYSIPMAKIKSNNDGSKEYTLNTESFYVNSVVSVINEARRDQAANNDNKYYFELPTNLDEYYGNMRGSTILQAVARILDRETEALPKNILFSSETAALLDNYRGGVDPAKINRTIPFAVTRNVLDRGYNISSLRPEIETIGDATIAELFNAARGYASDKKVSLSAAPNENSTAADFSSYEVYKDLWRQWAEANPSKFNKLAAEIGKKPIYDPYHNIKTGFSTGAVIADLLTERFVDISWVDFPRNEFDKSVNLEETQTWLPISMEDKGKITFSTNKVGGKAILAINGKPYIATLKVDRAMISDGIDIELESKLGISEEVENSTTYLKENYPFMYDEGKRSQYAVIHLQEFNNSLKESKSVKPGVFAEKFKAKGGKVLISYAHERAMETATVIYAIDTKARITDDVASAANGTPWIMDYRGVTGDGVVTELTADDEVMITGSRLEDKNSPSDIRKVMKSVRALIDKAARAQSKFIVGDETGIEEEAKAYIIDNYPKYRAVEGGFEYNAVYKPSANEKITVFKGGPPIARFNANNTLGREGDKLTGAFGTILSTDRELAGGDSTANSYELDLSSDEIRNWTDIVTTEEVMSMVNKVIPAENQVASTAYSSIRGNLLTAEQRFVKRMIGAHIIGKNISGAKSDIYNVSDFDVYLDEMLEKPGVRNEFDALYGKIMNESGEFKLSDVASSAMARSRNITINYMREILPELFESDSLNKVYMDLFNEERTRLDQSDGYYAMINSNYISDSDIKLLKESEGVTNRDLYNYLTTLGSNKIIAKGNRFDGQVINKLYKTELGIKAFKNDLDYVVLDNDAIITNRTLNTKSDFNPVSKYRDLVEIESKLAKSAPELFNYLNSKRLLRVNHYTETALITIGSELIGPFAIDEKVGKVMSSVKNNIAKKYFNDLEGVEIDDAAIEAIMVTNSWSKFRSKVNTHIRKGMSPFKANFNMMFWTNPDNMVEVPSPNAEITYGEVYKVDDETKSVILKDSEGLFRQDDDGKLYRVVDNEWSDTGILNGPAAEAKTYKGFPRGNDVGVYDQLLTTSGAIVGNFEVNEVMDTDGYEQASRQIATDTNSGVEYLYEEAFGAWSPMKSSIMTHETIMNFVDNAGGIDKGNIVLGLATTAGTVILKNGRAVDANTVKDDKGTYVRKGDVWEIQSTFGGFNNSEVKFQIDAITVKDTVGASKASRRVSKTVLTKVFNNIAAKINVEASLMTSEDIRSEFGEEFANASGFIKDGEVIVNTDKATLDTVLHELGGHLYIAHLKQTNPVAYGRVIEESVNHPIAKVIQKKYKGINKEELGQEVFATLLGTENQTKLEEQSLNLWQKIRNIANESSSVLDFFRNIFSSAFGVDVDVEFDPAKDSLMTILDKLGNDIIFGDASALSDLDQMQRKDIVKMLDPNLEESEITEKLTEMGYIKCI